MTVGRAAGPRQGGARVAARATAGAYDKGDTLATQPDDRHVVR